MYIGAERLALIGNKVKDSGQSHVVRVWQAYKSVISHNIISGSSLNSTDGRLALKFHGPGMEEYFPPVGSDAYLENRTEFAVISNNVFGGSGPWPVAIGPADDLHDCLVSDVIFEGNRIHPDYGSQSCCSSSVQVGLSVWDRCI